MDAHLIEKPATLLSPIVRTAWLVEGAMRGEPVPSERRTVAAREAYLKYWRWASPGFEGGLLFDESHKAKNLFGGNGGKPTKTGQAVLKLQTALPRARVVYCSATGASEPKHLGYMDRLGLWGGSDTPFGDFDDFRRAVESRGVGMMELVAMHLKQRGALVSRALSFKSCTFELVNDVMTPFLAASLPSI